MLIIKCGVHFDIAWMFSHGCGPGFPWWQSESWLLCHIPQFFRCPWMNFSRITETWRKDATQWFFSLGSLSPYFVLQIPGVGNVRKFDIWHSYMCFWTAELAQSAYVFKIYGDKSIHSLMTFLTWFTCYSHDLSYHATSYNLIFVIHSDSRPLQSPKLGCWMGLPKLTTDFERARIDVGKFSRAQKNTFKETSQHIQTK